MHNPSVVIRINESAGASYVHPPNKIYFHMLIKASTHFFAAFTKYSAIQASSVFFPQSQTIAH